MTEAPLPTEWLETRLETTREEVRAPRGFDRRVMDAVFREAVRARHAPAEAAPFRASCGSLGVRVYRRLGWSFLITAAVLAASLLIPRGAYSTLITPAGAGAALGERPSAAVQSALAGAGETVQGALGEKQIGGNRE